MLIVLSVFILVIVEISVANVAKILLISQYFQGGDIIASKYHDIFDLMIIF
jgi:hypothetical protein